MSSGTHLSAFCSREINSAVGIDFSLSSTRSAASRKFMVLTFSSSGAARYSGVFG
jgi:hypothetical protein